MNEQETKSCRYDRDKCFTDSILCAGGDHSCTGRRCFQICARTKINGVLVGGMTVEEAKVQIEGFYGKEYNLTIKERGDAYEVIKGSEIGYQMMITDGLTNILHSKMKAAG